MDKLFVTHKQVRLGDSERFHEAAFRVPMVLECPVFKDVPDHDIIAAHMTADQDHPVTHDRVLLGAQERDAKLLDARSEPIKTLLEAFGSGHAIELDLAVHVAGWIVHARTQFTPEKHIGDPACLQCLLERFPIELRIILTVGRGPDIAHSGHRVLLEQRDQSLDRMG